MAKVFIEESTLTAIGDAIRGKEGTTELIPVNAMATRISAIEGGGSGGGGDLPEGALLITGNCQYKFNYTGWNWFIDTYGDRVTTKDITTCSYMFANNDAIKNIPFQLNVKDCLAFGYMFSGCKALEVCPKIRGTLKWNSSTVDLGEALSNTFMLRSIEDLFIPEMFEEFQNLKITSGYGCHKVPKITQMRSLRSIPSWWYKFRINPESTAFPSYNYTIYYDLAQYCYVLDEITNMPVWACAGAQTSNMFSSSFNTSSHLRALTFETNEDGTPKTASWKSQTIDLSKNVGYYSMRIYFTDYGLTTDTLVTSDSSYQALKNDPDWWTTELAYSRYNHDSAVATINSLPDTSAYLASAGGTNTIKFKKASGSATDGGAIENLTAEEIAVATAKGWTVTLA